MLSRPEEKLHLLDKKTAPPKKKKKKDNGALNEVNDAEDHILQRKET